MAIIHQYKRKYATKAEETVAELMHGPGVGTEQEMKTVIKRKAAEISIAMAILHGGEWRVQIDHEEPFVYVTRRLSRNHRSAAKRD